MTAYGFKSSKEKEKEEQEKIVLLKKAKRKSVLKKVDELRKRYLKNP